MKKQIHILMLFFVVFMQAQQARVVLAPVNDESLGAIDLQNGNSIGNYPVVGTNISATISNVPLSVCDALRKDTWFTVIIPSSGSLTIETSQADSNSIFDTVMAVYSGIPANLIYVDCNDDLDSLSGFSKVSVSGRSPGEKLYVSVWRFGDSGIGDFKVSAFDGSILSTNQNNIESVSLYPNPATTTLNFSALKESYNCAVYNLLGQQVFVSKIDVSHPFIDIALLENGTYFLKLNNENSSMSFKFLKL